MLRESAGPPGSRDLTRMSVFCRTSGTLPKDSAAAFGSEGLTRWHGRIGNPVKSIAFIFRAKSPHWQSGCLVQMRHVQPNSKQRADRTQPQDMVAREEGRAPHQRDNEGGGVPALGTKTTKPPKSNGTAGD